MTTISSLARTDDEGRSRGEDVCLFIERFCRIPEGPKGRVGKKLELLPFQRRFILDVYDNPAGTRRAYLSIARKNGKSALIACIVLAHLVGPEALQNSQIICGARSREQAGIIFKLAWKMVGLNPALQKLIRPIPSQKTLIGLPMNVEFHAMSAEAGTAHGHSPVVAILDEVGQVKGPKDDFIEAIETAQGAYDEPLLIAISTQAPTAADLFSIWLDGADSDPQTVAHLYAASDDCEMMDEKGWEAANPALGVFRSRPELESFAKSAVELPSKESTFRWLYLNQRIEATSPFLSRSVWTACSGPVVDDFVGLPVYGGLDLSATADLTALVLVGALGGKWHVKPTFWLPADGLREKAQKDRVPYDVWAKQGMLLTTPGRSVEYEFVAEYLRRLFQRLDIRKLGFDDWNWRHLKPWLLKAGFSEQDLEEKFQPVRQNPKEMSPALRALESCALQGKLVHSGHPVMDMCRGNAVVWADGKENRMLTKAKSHGRIDGMVALALALAVAGSYVPAPEIDVLAMVA